MAVSFTLSLVDKISGPSKSITGSMGKLVQQAKTLQSAMRSTQAQMTKANALGDVAKVEQLTGKLGAYGDALSKLPAEAQGLASGSQAGAAGIDALAGAAAAGAAAVVALGVAVGALVVKGAQLAIEATEAKNKLTATFGALAGGATQGKQLVDQLEAMRGALGMTRDQLAPMAQELLGMGVPVGQLSGQLKALATVQAVGINGGTEEYLNILKKLQAETKVSSKTLENLYKTGVNVAEVAAKMGVSTKQLEAGLKAGTVDAKKFGAALTDAVTSKGAGALANQADSLSATVALAKERFADLFSGVATGPFLGAMKSLVGLLDQATPSGQALKKGLTAAFNSVFSVATKVVGFLKHAFLQMIVWGLQGYIAIKPLIKGFGELWSKNDVAGKLLTYLKALGIVVGVVAGAFAAVIAAGIAFQIALAATIGSLVGWVASANKAAADFILGLVNGITSGASKVIGAVKDLGKGMIDKVVDVFKIGSPSKVMAELGGHVTAGFTKGITSGNDNAFAAASGMAASTTAGASSGAGGGGGVNVNVGGIVIQGGSSPQETAKLLESELVTIFERMALTQGIGTQA